MEITSKTCSKCGVEKPFEAFHKNPMGKYGYKSVCYDCTHKQRAERRGRDDFIPLRKQWAKEQYLKNRESVLARTTAYRKARPELYKFYWQRWEENHREYVVEVKKKWREINRGLVAMYASNRRARKLQATPTWASDEFEEFFIEEIYRLAKARTEMTGIEHAVDHIVPLKSDLVCGLHCKDNLRVITKSENSIKSNKYWPDMP